MCWLNSACCTVLSLHQTDFDRSTFQSFSGFFPSYQHFPWVTCLLQCGPSQVCILMSCKQVRTSINDKTHVLVKHDLYNEIDNYMQLIFHLCSHFRLLIQCKSVSNVNFSFVASILKKNDDPQKPSVYFSCSIAVIMLFSLSSLIPTFACFPQNGYIAFAPFEKTRSRP